MKITLVLTSVFIIGNTIAYDEGAPTVACDTMAPIHGGSEPQDTPSPYLVSINPATFGPGATVTVKISTIVEDDYYKGFMVQVRNINDETLGKFEDNENYQVIDCPDGSIGTQNTATQESSEKHTTTEMIWIAPSTPTDVDFTFTILRDYKTYWTDIKISATMTADV